MHSLYAHLQHWAQRTPNQVFITEVEAERELTYQQCLQTVQSMHYHLGKTPKRVFMQLQSGILNAVIWLSTLTGGHTLVPLAPDASEADKQRAMRMFAPDMVFVEDDDDAQAFRASGSGARVITRREGDTWLRQALQEERSGAPLSPNEGYVCIMTSGTTGDPKGVVLAEHQVTWTAEQVRAIHQLTAQDRGFTPLPFFHVNAPVVSLCASLLAGASVIIAQRFSRRRFWSWIEHYRITWASLVPAIIAILLEGGETPEQSTSSLRFIRTGSAPLPAAHLKRFEEQFGIPVLETYGLSEAASMIVANPLPPEPHKPGSAGRPVGVSLRICALHTEEQRLRAVAAGEVGEICVRGPNVIDAYYGNADPEAFQDGWFRTGDLGYLDEDGYLFISGRLRAVINRGGENIAPREIEEVLQEHPAVREVIAVGRPNPIYGEVVVAYLTTYGAWDTQARQDLLTYARSHLSPAKVPVDFIALDALPKNRMGKLDRHTLKEREEKMICDTNYVTL